MCRRRGARAAVLGPRRLARVDDLARAVALGLGARPAGAVAATAAPEVGVGASEIEVRRLVADGAPAVIVRSGREAAGLIQPGRAVRGGPSVAARLEHAASREAEARLWLLRLAGKVGEALGTPVFAVGGLVRDLLRGRAALDIDLTVEGDGIAVARRLAEEAGGRLVI